MTFVTAKLDSYIFKEELKKKINKLEVYSNGKRNFED